MQIRFDSVHLNGDSEKAIQSDVAVYLKPDGVGEIDFAENHVGTRGVCRRIPADGEPLQILLCR